MGKNWNKITTLRISWDSWDGIQVIGNILTKTIALTGNNIFTAPDYPSEIRAPIGTLEWVSSFEISFWDENIIPPSNKADIIAIMNPAALKLNEKYLSKNSVLIINSSTFIEDWFTKAWYSENPIVDWKYNWHQTISIDLTEEIKTSLWNFELPEIQKTKCKNFYLLWYILGYLGLEINFAEKFINNKFSTNTIIAKANIKALKDWYNLVWKPQTNIEKIKSKIWKFKILSGNEIIAYSLITSAKITNKKLYFSGYPITPASDIMHTLAKYRQEDIIIVQAEDEISAIWWAIWWSYAGAIWVTATSWPGFSLKSEAINLTVMTELPLLVIDVQRWWPSTWLPTKTEQSDLLQAMFGRHWESPVVVIAISSNEESFQITQEAIRIAVKYMTPVILLSDSYLANNSSIFKIPELGELERIIVPELPSKNEFAPYLRDEKTLARPWITPWTIWYEHRIWWLEKDNVTWNISYNWENHELMTTLRSEKIMRVQNEIPETKINWAKVWNLLIIWWWSTYSSIMTALNNAVNEWLQVSSIHLTFINPLPRDIENIMKWFKTILVVEENSGQLSFILEWKLWIKTVWLNKIKWQKIFPEEVYNRIKELI